MDIRENAESGKFGLVCFPSFFATVLIFVCHLIFMCKGNVASIYENFSVLEI